MTFGDRQMHDVDINCAKCNTHISQLPFQPSGDRPVYCADCNRSYRESRSNDKPQAQMHEVDVDCAGCGTHISQLPFQPTGDKPVYCRDCMQARRNNA
jgi:CxxC-x17-CxxC domain-containing protein